MHLLSVVFLQTVDRSSWNQGHELGAVLELLSGLDWRVSSYWNGHTSCCLAGFLELFVVVLNWLNNSDLYSVDLDSFVRVLWVSLAIYYKRSAYFYHSIFNIHTQHNGVALPKDSHCLQDARKDRLLAFLYLPLLSHLIDVFGEIISQMIDDICSEDLDFILLGIFLSIR